MTIEKIRNNIASCIGKEYLFKVNGSRNQTEKFYGIITNIFHFICKYICHFPVMEVELQYDPVCRVIFCKSLICCAIKMLAQKL